MSNVDFAKYSIPTILYDPNDNNRPIGIGSCCVVQYKTRQFYFTVGHVASPCTWGIDTGYEELKGVRITSAGSPFSFSKIITNVSDQNELLRHLDHFQNATPQYGWNPTGMTDNDFAFARYKIAIPLTEMGKEIIDTDLETMPNDEDEYGFFGLVRRELVGENLNRTEKLETGLKFVGKEGNYFRFKPHGSIKEDLDYQGCSGAPILDQKGHLVGLVKGGRKEEGIIIGTPTSGINKLMIDVELGLIV